MAKGICNLQSPLCKDFWIETWKSKKKVWENLVDILSPVNFAFYRTYYCDNKPIIIIIIIDLHACAKDAPKNRSPSETTPKVYNKSLEIL